ncbi:MAG: NifB/NifX family molybdenum-iron cluster-binding protein [Lentisphaeria bacterium]|nr:NifB/NifX family molybdenum-iron cluster-binding protein [Lentisphaeria bacterium]
MNIALPTWCGRISPVLDVAENFLLVEAGDSGEVVRTEIRLADGVFPLKVGQLSKLGVEVLICGALSREMEALLNASGIQVIPHTCGPAEEVLQAFLNGQFTGETFLMPGCCGHRRRQGHRWQENQMNTQFFNQGRPNMPKRDGTGPQGQGPGTGRGKGTCGTGDGRGNRPGRGNGAGRGRGGRRGNEPGRSA